MIAFLLLLSMIFTASAEARSIVPSDGWTFGVNNWGISTSNVVSSHSFVIHEGALYVGVKTYDATPKAKLLRSTDGILWVEVTVSSFNNNDQSCRRLFSASDGYLYCITLSSIPRLHRSDDGQTNWSLVATFDSTDNYGRWMLEWNGYIYIAMRADDALPGRIIRCQVSAGCGTSDNWIQSYQLPGSVELPASLLIAGGYLYFSTNDIATSNGGIYRSMDGITFSKVNTSPATFTGYNIAHSLTLFKGDMYIGMHNSNTSPYNAAIYRSSDGGITWTKTFNFDAEEREAYRLIVIGGTLFVGIYDQVNGGHIYASRDGVNFVELGDQPFGIVAYMGPFDISEPFNNYVVTGSRTDEVNIPTTPIRWNEKARIPINLRATVSSRDIVSTRSIVP